MNRDEIYNEISKLKYLKRNYDERLASLPEGRVSFKKEKGSNALRVRNGGAKSASTLTDRYISLHSAEAENYATKLYLEKVSAIVGRRLSALERVERDYDYDDPAGVLEKFPDEARHLVRRPLLTVEEKAMRWEKKSFDSNSMPFDPQHNYTTMKGERVRSRAEIIIANMLRLFEIPYRYEAALWIGERVVYPDFTIMNPQTGELFYLEYFGMMDNPDYAAKQFEKIKEYSNTNLAENFIYVFEYGDKVSMDTEVIENLILRSVFRGDPKSLDKYKRKH